MGINIIVHYNYACNVPLGIRIHRYIAILLLVSAFLDRNQFPLYKYEKIADDHLFSKDDATLIQLHYYCWL